MYIQWRKLVHRVIALVLAESVCCGSQQRTGTPNQRADIITALRTTSNISELDDRLSDFPTDLVIEEIADRLATDPTFEEPKLRTSAYHILVKRSAQMNPVGRRQLRACLAEERNRALCANALEDVPPEARQEVIESLAQVVGNADDQTSSTLIPVIRTLGKLAPVGSPQMAVLENVFNNRALSREMRSEALKAMVTKGPITRILEISRDEDRPLLVGVFAFVGGETGGQFDGVKSTMDRIRVYVREAARSEDKGTRELAFYGLPMVYGQDALLGDPNEGYQFDPAFLQTIENMARSDPDEELRSKAQHWIETADQRMKTAIRRRENPEKYKPRVLHNPEGDNGAP